MNIPKSRLLVTGAIVACMFAAALIAQQQRNISGLVGRTDSNLNLYVRAEAAGAAGQSSNIGGLVGRTDANLNLYVTFDPTVPVAMPASTVSVNGIAAVSTDGFTIQNTTAALVGAQTQISPRQKFCGTAWKSNATAVSETDCWIIENRPVPGAAATTSALWFSSSIAGGAYTDQMSINSAGLLTLANNSLSAVGITLAAGSNLSTPGGVPVLAGSTPTISSGFGGTPSVTAGKAWAFRVNVGTGGAATTGVIAIGSTAAAGWNCTSADVTTPDSFNTVQTASSTTTASFKNYSRTTGLAIAWTASDILAISCVGF
jgi:hypothetical protein